MEEAKENRKVVIELQNVKRYFQVGSETVKALRGVSFKIYEGEFVTIQGTSGSGKSTLLNQLGCLDTPTSGEYFLDGVSVRTMSKTQRAHLPAEDHSGGERRAAADVQLGGFCQRATRESCQGAAGCRSGRQTGT